MRLTHIAIEGVGKFGTPARVEGLGPGINVLAAGNEAGKSTLFRAIRTCLFERHGTRSSEVLGLATEGLSLPLTISIGFMHSGKQYELSKSLIRSASASLRRDGVEIARNREADELVWEILGVNSGGGRSVDDAAFGVLWVGQGQSFDIPKPSEAATSALNAVIQQEVGTLVGGERAREVIEILKSSLSRQLTERTSQPRAGSELAEAARQVETTALELQAAEERLKGLDDSLDELARFRNELRRVSDPAEFARLKSELEEAIQQLRSAEETEVKLRQIETEERHSRSLLNGEIARHAGLQELCVRIDANRQRIEELKSTLKPLDERKAATNHAIASAYVALRQIDESLQMLDLQDADIQRKLSLLAKAAKAEGSRSKLEFLRKHEERSINMEAALKSISVDEAAIRALEEIERDLATLTASAEAAAALISIDRESSGQVTLNGQDLPASTTRSVTETLTVCVRDIATITVSPPQTGYAAAQKQREKLNFRLNELLRLHGVTSVSELRNARTARSIVEEDARTLKAERIAMGLKDSPATEIAKLSTELAQIDNEFSREFAGMSSPGLPSEAQLERHRAELLEKRQELRTNRTHHEGIIEGHNATLARITTDQGGLQGQLIEIERQLVQDVSQLPDEERKTRMQAAEESLLEQKRDHDAKAAALEAMRKIGPGSDEMERRRMRVSRLQEGMKNRESQLGDLGRSVARLEGQVQIAGGDGLGERVAELRAQLEWNEAELNRQKSRVATLRLLRQVIEQCYDKRKEQLQAPLRRHLKPYLNDVFPNAEIELGDEFSVSGLRRSGPDAESFDRLSKGTQEQIAVLVRLAMGAMFAERGQEVPIILDDALVFSDDERIEQMFDALKRAAQNQQIIILTCRTRTFASLGGQQLRITR